MNDFDDIDDFESKDTFEEENSTGDGFFDSDNYNSFEYENDDNSDLFEPETDEQDVEQTDHSQISFEGNSKYTSDEVRRFERNVRDLECKVSYAKSDVQHWQRCCDLSKSSGDLSKLRDAQSRLSNLEYKLRDARIRLNNAR